MCTGDGSPTPCAQTNAKLLIFELLFDSDKKLNDSIVKNLVRNGLCF